MRIVIVQRRFHPNTHGWVEGLTALGNEVRLVLHQRSPGDPQARVPVVMAPPSPRLTRTVRWASRARHRRNVWVPHLRTLWREFGDADLVLIKQVRFTSVIVALVALLRRVRRIAWANDPARFERRHWRWLFTIGILPRRRVWTTTGTGGTVAALEGATDRSFVPYAVVAPDAPDAPDAFGERAPGGPIRILTVGKYSSARKRSSWTLAAAENAGLLDGSCTFSFVGGGRRDDPEAERIEAIAGHTGAGDLVSMHFNVAYEDMGRIYREHDLLVAPSRDEPFGMVVLEAMAHGLAVVVSDSVGARCCVLPGETGIVFPTDDFDALSSCLAALIASPDDLARMGERGRAIAATYLTPVTCASRIVGLAGSRPINGRRSTTGSRAVAPFEPHGGSS